MLSIQSGLKMPCVRYTRTGVPPCVLLPCPACAAEDENGAVSALTAPFGRGYYSIIILMIDHNPAARIEDPDAVYCLNIKARLRRDL